MNEASTLHKPVLHSWYMALVARDNASVHGVNFTSRPLTIQCCMVKGKRSPFGTFCELITISEITQCTVSIDFTGVAELRIREETISGVPFK